MFGSKLKTYFSGAAEFCGLGYMFFGRSASNKAVPAKMDESGQLIVTNDPVASLGFDDVTTSATGATYVSLAAQTAKSVNIANGTGTNIDITIDGGTNKFVLPTSASACIELPAGNASIIQVRRTDNSNTQVTLYYKWVN